MKKTTDPKLPLKDVVDVSENDIANRRQRLADLLGKLLARHWLKMQEHARGNQADRQTGVDQQDVSG